MIMKIERDQRRFRQIVRGRIRQNLRKYVTHGEMIGRKGRDLVSIPVPSLDVPHFRFGDNGAGGVGQGDGEEGQPVAKGGKPQEGQGPAGSDPGSGHLLEVDITLEELAEILGDELELPRIEPRGQASIVQEKSKYNSSRQTGPGSHRHFKRTYRKAPKRQISPGVYEPDDPRVVPIKADKQYRSWNKVEHPQVNAAVIYMMDVSGSMTDEQKEIVRTEAFWIDTWLSSQYDGIETRYIIHDAVAKEVDEHTFYHTRESGGTKISTAYDLADKIITKKYPSSEWNGYAFHFSDGDNRADDHDKCLAILKDRLLPKLNLFGYSQVESPYGSGEFMDQIEGLLEGHPNVIATKVPDKQAILASIKLLLGTGR